MPASRRGRPRRARTSRRTALATLASRAALAAALALVPALGCVVSASIGTDVGGAGAGAMATTASTLSVATGTGGGALFDAGACPPSSATCIGGTLQLCDALGNPQPPLACGAPSLCDPIAGACNTFGRLAVGVGQACAIEDDHSVSCWGLNAGTLVLGDPHTILPTATPADVGVPAWQISVGASTACALRDDGFVTCWGNDDDGLLGIAPVGVAALTPQVPGLSAALEVQVGDECACARLADGTVDCWGLRDHGCLGTGTTVTGVQPEVTPIDGVSSAVQLRVGGSPTIACARLLSGQVKCWGGGVTPSVVPAVSDATDVAVGNGYVFIQLPGIGLVWTTLSGGAWQEPVPYTGSAPFKAISVGSDLCGITAAGLVACASLTEAAEPPLPALVPDPPPGTAVEVASGYALTYGQGLHCLRLAVASLAGSVYCWGDDTAGALGAGAPSYFRAPVAVKLPEPVTALSAGSTSTSVVLADGSASFWGTSPGLAVATQATPAALPALGATNTALGTADEGGFAYALQAGGAPPLLVEMGAVVPAERLLAAPATDFTFIKPTSTWDLGLRTGGQVVAFGATSDANTDGIFGIGVTTATAGEIADVPLPAAALILAAYGDPYGAVPGHACAVLATGELRCWGTNLDGECGQAGPPVPASVLSPAAVTLPAGAATLVSLAAGRDFTCAVDASGAVYCWGSNLSGALGLGQATTFSTAAPTVVPGVAGALGVSAGPLHACAWLADGTVRCWGNNQDGELGIGSFDDQPSPVAVPGLSGVSQVSAGTQHTCARLAGGAVSCWGASTSGQVGATVTSAFASPLPVQGL